MDWDYMNFEETVPTDIKISKIQEIIFERHGKVENLKICIEDFRESNEIQLDDGDKLLKDYDTIKGSLIKEDAPVVDIIYNFKPIGSDNPDPILLSWMQ